VWVLVRAAATAAAAAQNAVVREPPGVLDALGAGGILGAILLTLVLGRVDAWRRREGVLLANLGVGEGRLAVMLAAPAVAGEAVIAVTARLLGSGT
jgi:hypothetical protein